MQIKKEKLPQSKIKLEITIPAEDFTDFIQEATKALSREIKVKGFRPGRIPAAMVKEKAGEGTILQEAADLAVRGTYLQALKEEKVEPLGVPEIKVLKLAPGNDFIYEARIFILPEVKLPDYKKISREILKKAGSNKTEVKEEELQKALDWLADSRSKTVTVARAAQKGDRVEIDFEVSQKGVVIEGGQSTSHPLIIGQGRFVPGFEEKLTGMKEGEEKEFSLAFPDDYHVKNLAGKPADFKVKMKLVQEKQKPELNDEFAVSLGRFKNVEELKKSVADGLKQEKENKQKQERRMQIIEEIAQKADFETPEILLEEELGKMLQEFKAQITQMGMEFDKYLANIKKTEADLKKEWEDKAKQRVRIGLTLRQIATEEKISPSQVEIEEEAGKILKSFGDVKQAQNSIDSERLREYTKGALINEKVFAFLEKQNLTVK